MVATAAKAWLAAICTRLLDRLEDLELAELVRARANERRIKIALDDP